MVNHRLDLELGIYFFVYFLNYLLTSTKSIYEFLRHTYLYKLHIFVLRYSFLDRDYVKTIIYCTLVPNWTASGMQ